MICSGIPGGIPDSFPDPLLAIISSILFISYSFYLQRVQEESNIMANKTEDFEKANVADIFTNIDTVKYYGKEKFMQRKYYNLSDNTRRAFLKNWGYFRWMSSGQSLIIGLSIFALMFFSIKSFLAGTMSLGTITFIYTVYYTRKTRKSDN